MNEVEDDVCILPQEIVSSESLNSAIQEQNNEPRKKGLFIFVLEPAVFLVFFGMNLSGVVLQNQIMFTACTNVFHYNQSDCAVLGMKEGNDISQEIANNVQPYVAKIIMVRTLLESIIPAIISLFVGPWSDRFGRKPVIFAAFTGYFLGYIILSVLAFLSTKYTLNPWLFIMSAIPVSFLGGNCGVIAGIFCYIADVALAKDRAYRMVVNEAAIYIGLMLGSLLSSYLLAATNTVTVFACSGLVFVFAIIYVVVLVDESIVIERMDKKGKARELFRWNLIIDMFKTCFEKRPNNDRAIIWLIMIVLATSIFVIVGDSNVFYLFTMEKFNWTIKEYTLYDATSIIILITGNIIGVYILQKLMRLSITALALIAFGSCVLDSLIKATAIYSWQLYLAVSIGFLKGIGGPMCRAILSLVVPTSDIGKIFSFATSIETITPLASSPLYTFVYSSTLTTNPGVFNFISTGFYFLCYILLVIIFGIQKSSPSNTYGSIG